MIKPKLCSLNLNITQSSSRIATLFDETKIMSKKYFPKIIYLHYNCRFYAIEKHNIIGDVPSMYRPVDAHDDPTFIHVASFVFYLW